MRRDSDKYAEEHAHDDDKPETIEDLMKDETVDAGESGEEGDEKNSDNNENSDKSEAEGKDEK